MKRIVAGLLCLMWLALAPTVRSAHADAPPPPLQGLIGFDLLTAYANPFDGNPVAARQALREGARSRLLAAGLPLVSRDQAAALPGRPRLLILIGVLPDPFCGTNHLYEIEVTLEEEFVRLRQPQFADYKEVWTIHFNYLSVQPENEAADMVENALYVLSRFIEDYQAANPRGMSNY